MKKTIKRAADIFFTLVLGAALSGCASMIEYWTLDESGSPVLSAEADEGREDAAGIADDTGAVEVREPEQGRGVEQAVPTQAEAQLRELQRAADEARQAQKDAEDDLVAARTRVTELEAAAAAMIPTVEAEAQIQELQRAADEARQAQKDAEDDLVAARTRIAELEAVAAAPPAAETEAPSSTNTVVIAAEAAAARQMAADAEAARKQAEDELAAARTRITELEAAAAMIPTAGTEAQIQELQRAVDEARRAQKDAEDDLASARTRIAELEAVAATPPAAGTEAPSSTNTVVIAAEVAAARQMAAEAEAARKQAEDELAAAQKKTADAEAARERAEAELAKRSQLAVAVKITPATTETWSVENNTPQAAALETTAPPPAYFTVDAQRANCFWRIAELVYGDPFRWPIIYRANRDKLEDPDNPDLLEVGIVLKIPSLPDAPR
jgi:nucleoid-associated protein YgaU